jgi:uncharacterized protein (TIGR02265 family)
VPVGRDFTPPDFSSPFDVAERLRAVPPEATVKGMFFDGPITEAFRRSGDRPGKPSYVSFKDYPLTEHIQVLVACAMAGYPDVPIREGLRRLGHDAFRTFLESLAGKVLFSVAGRNFDAALGLVARSYGIAGPVGTATVIQRTPDAAVIHMKDIYNMPDCYHVGVFEAAMEYFRKDGEVLTRVRTTSDVDIKMALR